MQIVAAVVAALGFLMLVAAGHRPNPSTATESGSDGTLHPVSGIVQRVIDGDTLTVNVNGQTETVRLLGIDTPEKDGGPRPAECFGEQATARTRQLLPQATTVLLSRDVETRDQYGRLLAFVHRADDHLFVNLELIRSGHAAPLFFAPNTTHQARFQAAADGARRAWIGFWPTCGAADAPAAGADPHG